MCRAKAYLVTHEMLKHQNDLLLSFTHSKFFLNFYILEIINIQQLYLINRLINSLERDNRKNFPIKEENDFIQKIIDQLLLLLTNIAVNVLGIKKTHFFLI
jgi:hypothetical protein